MIDCEKLSKFIIKERKAKRLTQAKLAEKLFVSEKTISKWEQGNGVPDVNTLLLMCEVFGISLNELLNAERITKENYVEKAEEKLLELQKSKVESDKRLLHAEIVIGSITTVSFLFNIFISIFLIKQTAEYVFPIIGFVVGLVIFIVGITFCLRIEQKTGYYRCEKCNNKYVPSFSQVLLAPHVNRTRYMKCPYCKKKSWQKKTIR